VISEIWPGTPEPRTAVWAERCGAELLRMDQYISEEDARLLALDMSTEASWRRHEPDVAARLLFGPVRIYPNR
jgi:hypothetical protein